MVGDSSIVVVVVGSIVVVGGGMVVEVVVEVVVVVVIVVVGALPCVVGVPSVVVGSPNVVGGAVLAMKRRVVVGAGAVSGGAVDEIEATGVGAPSRLSGGSAVVEVRVGSRRGAVTGARLAASVRTSDFARSSWAATEMLVTMPTPKTVLAMAAKRRSNRAGWGLRRRRRAGMHCFRRPFSPS